jgi:5-methylcytosine-specific restriction endonuclease McrBC regulatory subunit McrC
VTVEVVECEEFGEIEVRISRLLANGELALDPRIQNRGYLNVSLAKGQVVFRADRHVGLIPINANLAVRVRPRASIANLSYMIARSGVAPVAIPAYSRGYLPRFETAANVERVYRQSLLLGISRVVERGLMKAYLEQDNPPKWRGRFLISETIKRHVSKGVKYKQEFSFSTLSLSSVENIALKTALDYLMAWLEANDRNSPELPEARRLQKQFAVVEEWRQSPSALVSRLGRRIPLLPPQLAYYRDPLWMAFLILQRALPDVGADGSVALDSLITDVSKVFEAYVRRGLVDRAGREGWKVADGTLKPSSFFTDNGAYEVRPDIVISTQGRPIAVLDAKYKPRPKESDRYELLSFMDALGVEHGAFVCPATGTDRSGFIGTTGGGKRMSLLRYDLSAEDAQAEEERFFNNVRKLAAGFKDFD